MNDYSPAQLASKWKKPIVDWAEKCQQLWEKGRPRKRWYHFNGPESDIAWDRVTPRADKTILAYEGRVVMAHFARAFFPAYIPGKVTHYGSVVYASDPHAADEVFNLAWRVNQLRQNDEALAPNLEIIGRAIRNDRSDFSRLEFPAELEVGPRRYFGNICIQRSRLPLGYIHSRLVPILICPDRTPWCALLPLRYWDAEFVGVWSSGAPSYPAELFEEQCRNLGIKP